MLCFCLRRLSLKGCQAVCPFPEAFSRGKDKRAKATWCASHRHPHLSQHLLRTPLPSSTRPFLLDVWELHRHVRLTLKVFLFVVLGGVTARVMGAMGGGRQVVFC